MKGFQEMRMRLKIAGARPVKRVSLAVHVSLALLLSFGAVGLAQERFPQSAPDTGPNLPAQPIGANDLLAISVYGAPELTRTVRVSAEGEIRLPMLKRRIVAKGKMPSALEDDIAGALSEEEILVDPAVTVTIAEYNSRPISVAGAVKSRSHFKPSGK